MAHIGMAYIVMIYIGMARVTLGVEYCNIRVWDRESADLTPHLPRMVEFIAAARSQPGRRSSYP